MSWYFKCWKNYATFNGRARRKEFCFFTLFDIIFLVIFTIMNAILFKDFFFAGIYLLARLLPSIAVTVRRLHDVDRSGGWVILMLVFPPYGLLEGLYLLRRQGTSGPNRFGDDPKGETMTNEMKNKSSSIAKVASNYARICAWTSIIAIIGRFFLICPALVLVFWGLSVVAWISGITGIVLGICALTKLNDEEKQESIWNSKTSKGRAFSGIITFPVIWIAVSIVMLIIAIQ